MNFSKRNILVDFPLHLIKNPLGFKVENRVHGMVCLQKVVLYLLVALLLVIVLLLVEEL